MKNIILKNINLSCIVALLICSEGCVRAQKQHYQAMAKNLASSHEWVSFEMVTEMQKDDSILWTRHENVVLHYDGKNPVIFTEWIGEDGRINKSNWMDKDKYIMVDHTSQEITRYDNKRCFGTTTTLMEPQSLSLKHSIIWVITSCQCESKWEAA